MIRIYLSNFLKTNAKSLIVLTHVMKGKRSSDNCYLLTCLETCCTTLLKNSCIWHQRLDHINHKSLNEIVAVNVVLRIPKMKSDLENVCGPCQIEK